MSLPLAGEVRAALPLPPVEERAALPAGFAVGAARAGLKESGRPDLAVVAVSTPEPAAAAGRFTTNLVAAAPVRRSRAHLAASGGHCRGVIVTSGCANAATGAAGEDDQARVAAALAAGLGCPLEETLMAATGLIGTRLHVERIEGALADLLGAGLGTAAGDLTAAATAIMTTDTRVKLATCTLALPTDDGSVRQVRVSGLAKGVGMIHPRMATLVAIVLTDAVVAPELLDDLLGRAVGATFDQLSVDGDTSTNDTVLALASGASDTLPLRPRAQETAAFGAALEAVCRSLARQQAADGEGATTLLTCRVSGAADVTDARAIARAVVSSNLVKAAAHGRDPNWGRVASASGAARRADGAAVRLDPERLAISLAGRAVFGAGGPLAFDGPAIAAAMDAPELLIEVDLGLGEAAAEAWGCDLTEAYVRVNAEYST
ncbi:MAG TPA: bifunctional glutamate N-acetyltransferase/amino-acid acetyltransferase ArgJ [Candidatus Limnocylindrales bacterium]|nr:bifunctional glutamate N-acetyltransferase/amino-acid acetyltransferase ArgJ [Candidatus Limnocylindrales bacterium]